MYTQPHSCITLTHMQSFTNTFRLRVIHTQTSHMHYSPLTHTLHLLTHDMHVHTLTHAHKCSLPYRHHTHTHTYRHYTYAHAHILVHTCSLIYRHYIHAHILTYSHMYTHDHIPHITYYRHYSHTLTHAHLQTLYTCPQTLIHMFTYIDITLMSTYTSNHTCKHAHIQTLHNVHTLIHTTHLHTHLHTCSLTYRHCIHAQSTQTNTYL